MSLHSFLKGDVMDHNSQKFPKKICILTKTNIYMENLENLMIKVSALEIFERFNDSPKEQLELAQLIFRCGIRGDEIKSDNLAVDIAAKAILKDSYLSRDNYKQRCKKNAKYGILGKEYGILGKKYGKLGGRPRKGETKEQYKERKRLENEALISENKDIYALADEYAKERKEKATKEELKLWDCIKELGLPNIYFQQPVFISGKNGKPCKFYIADFLDVDNKIDIEIDGGYHTSEEQRMKDEERERDFKKMGYETLRITNDEVNSGKAIERIKWFRDKNIL